MRLQEWEYPTFMLERMTEPPKSFMREYRQMHEAPYDLSTGKRGKWPENDGKPVPTQEEFRAFHHERDRELERREERRQKDCELSKQSFGSESNKVRFDYKGATITLDADDEAGIERMMKRIENGR